MNGQDYNPLTQPSTHSINASVAFDTAHLLSVRAIHSRHAFLTFTKRHSESNACAFLRGRLWAGIGSDSTTSLWDGAQRQVATAPLGSPLLAGSMHGMLAGSSTGTLVRECLRLAAHGRRWQCCT